MKKIIISILKIVLFCYLSVGQTIFNSPIIPAVIPPSPSVAALAKFADIPVNMHTGLPHISIPFYSLETKENKMTISLDYHASGVKVNEIPSWSGQGWALNAGGVITRSIVGKPDEGVGGFLNQPHLPSSYSNNCLQEPSSIMFGRNVAVEKTLDSEPDIFYYNFAGYSGKFYLNNETKKVVQVPLTNLKIEYMDNMLNSWKITDERGIVYFFNDTEETSFTQGQGTFYKSSWHLSSILPSSGIGAIILTYESEDYDYELPVNETRFRVVGGESRCQDDLPSHQKIFARLLTRGAKRIRKISFPSGEVEFMPGNFRKDFTGGRTLGEIRISENGRRLKTFRFKYLYFSSGSNQADSGGATETTVANTQLRLFLTEIQEFSDNNDSSLPPYQFNYFSPNILRNTLPDRYSSFAQDHWGYYNGETDNVTLIPSEINVPNWMLNKGLRHPVEAYAKIGSLSMIKYPSGGTREFEMEMNDTYLSGLPSSTKFFSASINIGSCHVTSNRDFIINNELSATTRVKLDLQGGPIPFIPINCNGNTSGQPNANNPSTWIYFQILRISNTSSPVIVYNSTAWLTLGSSTGGSAELDLPNGSYRIKAIRGNSNLTITAPELIGANANFAGSFTFRVSGYYNEKGKNIGGLRIKKIIDFDPLYNKTRIKSYDYTEGGTSTGITNFIPHYSYNYTRTYTCTGYPDGEINLSQLHYIVTTANSGAPLTMTNGALVGYGKVTEIEEDTDIYGRRTTNGKVENFFSNPMDKFPNPAEFSGGALSICFNGQYPAGGNSIFPYAPPISMDWRRGLLIKQIFYKSVGQDYRPIKEVVNTYKTDFLGDENFNNATDIKAIRMGISATPDWTPGSNYRFAVQYYYIPSRYSKLIKTETFHYNDNEKHLLARMSYKYDPETQLIVEKTNVRSNQDSIIQKFRYPKDYQSSEPYLSMYNKRIWNAEIQRSIFINDTLSNPVYSIQHTYKTWNGYDNHIFPFETMVKASENVSFEKFSEILRYDGFGNPVEIKKQNGNTTVYIWGYSGKYPVAKIENATYTSVLSVLGYYYTDAQVRLNLLNASSVTETFIQTTIESIRQELRGSLVTTYTYSPFSGMTSMTDPRGNTEYYQYDGFQRLRTVLDAEHNVLEYYQYHYKP